ncbi:MAG: tetratricopeptide repeat protein [Alphaproteobacteria bacterium]
MKRFLLGALASMALALPAYADIAAGQQAYLAGNYGTALKELLPLAKQGDAEAQYLVGVMRDHGQGVARNYRKAAEWYRKAADQGHTLAQFNLGFLYYNGTSADGDPIPQSYIAAAAWLGKAAESGLTMAQALLGWMYFRGVGVARDYEQAMAWTRKAAYQGIAQAQYNAGLMYARGQGVPQDSVMAFAWLSVAADKGYPGAVQNLEILARQLTPDDVAVAQGLAAQLKARE